MDRITMGTSAGHPRRVLVVEDDADLRELMAQMLVLEGYEARVAVNGLDGLRQAQAFQPHVIVLDLMMPVMDGWTFRIQQKLDREIASIPVVVLSAAPPDRLANLLDPQAVIQKPCNYDHLLAAVREYSSPHERADHATPTTH
jgi:CheY-like chemotaxis protein